MIRQRVTPREYERYRQDPERPALLQALRAHEIGGRRIEDSLDAITADPMTGLRSIAAGLHGRLGKAEPPARGETRTWAERAPQNAPEPVREAARMLDARQAELGRQLAERPPLWAISAWGVPPSEAESAARRADWEKQAGIVGTYREAAGHHRPGARARPRPIRPGATTRGLPLRRSRPAAARRSGHAAGHGPRRSRGHRRRV